MRHQPLDVLRGIAIFLALGNHIYFLPERPFYLQYRVLDFWEKTGWMGVDLFFILSGLLVSQPLFERMRKGKPIHIGSFLIRRAFKIYPSFIALVLATCVYQILTKQFNPSFAVTEILTLQSYLSNRLWSHTWSLSVEQHFYLFLAFGIWILNRRKTPVSFVPSIIVALIVVCFGLRVVMGLGLGWELQQARFPSVLRLDALGCGVALAYYFQIIRRGSFDPLSNRWLSLSLLFLSVVFGGVYLAHDQLWVINSVGLSLISLSFTSLVGWTARLPSLAGARNFALSFMAMVGRISYNVYLWHLPVIMWVITPLHRRGMIEGWGALQLYLLLSLLVGWLATLGIENAGLKFRDRFLSSFERNIERHEGLNRRAA